MKTTFKTCIAIALLALTVPAGASQWIHVSVSNKGNDAENVRVNLPLSVAQAFLPAVEEQISAEIKNNFDGKPLPIEEIRKAWKELSSQKNTELVAVDTKEANIRVSIEDGNVLVRTTKDSAKQINVKLPVAVVDALLSGEGDTLAITAAFEQLLKIRHLDLVQVQDEEHSVQVWIDNKNQF